MDNPNPNDQQGEASSPPPDFSPGTRGKQETNGLSARHNASQDNNHPPDRSVWARWQEHTLSDRVMAYFTGVVALCAALQVWILVGGSGQTDQLITAARMSAHSADHNATSAFSFAQSAEDINHGIGDAVIELDVQAKALEASRKTAEQESRRALQATIDNFHQEQRAWVGIKAFAVADRAHPNYITVGQPLTAALIITNFGRTPAFHESTLVGIEVLPSELKFSPPQYKVDPTALRSESILFPDVTVTLQTLPANSATAGDTPALVTSQDVDAVIHRRSVVYAYGLIRYKDAHGGRHITHFCEYLRPDLLGYSACDTYNDAN